MKNLTVFILIAFSSKALMGQNKHLNDHNMPYSIIDTVNTLSAGDYYLLDISAEKPDYDVIVRKLNEKYAIARCGKNQASRHSDYYVPSDSWKLSTRLLNRKERLHTKQLFSVKYADVTDADFLSDKEGIELVRIMAKAHVALIKTTADVIRNELILHPNVEYVDQVVHEAREESPIRQYNMGLNKINYARHNYSHLDGKDMTISVKEHSIFEGDIDLIGRVVLDENSSNQFTQHAREMGTLIAGKGNSFRTGAGVVQDAQLVSTNFDLLFAEAASYYDAYGIRLQNHSYGTGIENYYGTESISFDQLAVDRPHLVHVFSAGNMGDQAAEEGIYHGIEGYANLTGTFKQAKNVLVIGALDSTGNYVERSSSGPAYDGRIKPELCAFGGEGSSESAALVSGSVAMLQDHYRNLYDAYPSSALVKSLLIAGADDVHTPGIDFKTGYGSLDLNTALQLLDSGWFREGPLESNSRDSWEIAVPENVRELKVVLSWIDPPANPEDATSLVNDLDMSIVSPSATLILPWVLNATPDANSLADFPARGEDHLNTVEMISLENPEPGNYAINITSGQQLEDEQKYSLAYYLKYQDQFAWTFPTSSDYLEGGSQVYVRWDSSYPRQVANLFIRYGDGLWQLLGQADIQKGLFKHTLKDTSTTAQLKMVFSGQELLSDIFTVSRLPVISVENDCDDEFILSWNAIENAESYALFELQNDELAEVLSTTDTLIILDKTIYEGSHYAVQPVYSQERKGLRSYAINYEDNNKGCYLSNFLAYLGLNDRAIIQLSVNLPQDIEKISILKEQGGIRQLFAEFSPDETSFFEFEDGDLSPGRIAYSSQLLLNTGATIASDTLSFFYTDPKTVIVFPNPTYDDFASVLNDFPGGSLQLFDDRGTFVRTYELVSMVESLELTGLRRGTYLFRIHYQGEMVHSGKIIRM